MPGGFELEVVTLTDIFNPDNYNFKRSGYDEFIASHMEVRACVRGDESSGPVLVGRRRYDSGRTWDLDLGISKEKQIVWSKQDRLVVVRPNATQEDMPSKMR